MRHLHISLYTWLFCALCAATYIPQTSCDPGSSKIKTLTSGMARLQLDSGTKSEATNLLQPARPYGSAGNVHSGFARVLQASSGVTPEKKSRFKPGQMRSASAFAELSPIKPYTFTRRFVRGFGTASGACLAVACALYMAGWLEFRLLDDARMPLVLPVRFEHPGNNNDPDTHVAKQVPAPLAAPLLRDMQEYRANRSLLSERTMSLLASHTSRPSHPEENIKRPLQGDWTVKPFFDFPEQNISVTCDKEGCELFLRFSGFYWENKYVMGKLHYDPANIRKGWGVLPVLGQLMRTGGAAEPHYISAEVIKNSLGKQELHLKYYDNNDKIMMKTLWLKREKNS